MSHYIIPIVFGIFGLVMAGLTIAALCTGYWIGRGGSRFDRRTSPGLFWLGVVFFALFSTAFFAAGVYKISR